MSKNYRSVEEYAIAILAEHHCDCYTYGGVPAETILSDLKEGYPNGMEYPYVDVANAIAAISRVEPIVRSPYQMIFDTDSCCDGIDFESFEAAKADAEDTLIQWMVEERSEWEDLFHPNDEELDNYNYMICNCSVWVGKYNPDTDEYEEEWSPSYEDAEALGWYELTREILAKEEADYNAGMARPKEEEV
jgi:hypothetical protein